MSMTLAARASHYDQISGRAPARKSSSAKPYFVPLVWFARKLKARPGTTLAHCVFSLAAVIILANALAFQRQDNPRSFIGTQATAQAAAQAAAPGASQPRTVQPMSAVPTPPARPAEFASSPVRAPAGPPAAREQATARDPIGDLIRSGQVSGATPTQDQQRAAPASRVVTDGRPVLAAQRALIRIGLGPIKADGVFGEETRAALERFERERRIPVTRDLSPRTLRELTAASGMRME